MQKLIYIYSQFGNGDIEKGKELLKDIAERLDHARVKHTKEEWQSMNVIQAFNALKSENDEIDFAIKYQTEQRLHDELLDGVAVAVRMLNKEYKNNGKK